jgi:hypothetical protein
MKTRDYLFLILALVMAVLLALPKAAYWEMALGIAALVTILGFRLPDRKRKHPDEQQKSLPGSAREMSFLQNFGRPEKYEPILPGPIREMSYWIQRGRGGIFPKWHIAHILAELALDILDHRGIGEKNARQITGPEWNPTAGVKKYLDAAITTDYTDYPKPKWFSLKRSTPFDQDPEPVIDTLESLLESEK